MRIAIPVSQGVLCAHFGHCETFAMVEIDPETNKILGQEDLPAPPHEPGKLPVWLAEKGANMILAGGMGGRAQQLFVERGIEVRVGMPSMAPQVLVEKYLAGEAAGGANACDHGPGHTCDH